MLPDQSIIGGAPFNFTYRIHSLGDNGLMISRVGDDQLGHKALRRIWNMGLSFDYIQNDRDHPTGTVDVYFDDKMDPDYTINREVAYDYIDYTTELEKLCESVDCFCYGTLAQRNNRSKNTLNRLLDLLNNAICFYDINLRKDCYSKAIIEDSLVRANILKLNDSEAATLKEMLSLPVSGLPDFCKSVIDSYNLEICLVTLGDKGVLAVSRPGEICYVPGYRVDLTDPLGAGDAFSAGFINSWLRNKKLSVACGFGNTMGALVATQKGATVPLKLEEIRSFVKNTFERNIDESLKEYLKY